MFVTSDIFDGKRLGRWHGIDWTECLISGLGLHGFHWPGSAAAARFLLEAVERCGLSEELGYANYLKEGDKRQRELKPKSFEKIARGELTGAREAVDLLLRGLHPIPHARDGCVVFGGIARGDSRWILTPTGMKVATDEPANPLGADFVFPLCESHVEIAIDIFKLGVDLLNVEYGYYFIRDEMFFPIHYASGMGGGLDFTPPGRRMAGEIVDWWAFVDEGLWTGSWPLLRDLYQMNLISDRHTSRPIDGLGRLDDWISAQPGRGSLTDLGRGRLLWTLTDAELVEVRPQLNQAGILFSCHERTYRDLPGKWAERPVS